MSTKPIFNPLHNDKMQLINDTSSAPAASDLTGLTDDRVPKGNATGGLEDGMICDNGSGVGIGNAPLVGVPFSTYDTFSVDNKGAIYGQATLSGNITGTFGSQGRVIKTGATANTRTGFDCAKGLLGRCEINGPGAVTEIAAFQNSILLECSATTVASAISVHIINAFVNAGAITTQYGVKVEDLNSGGSNYSVYTGSAPSYFGGTIEIRNTASQIKVAYDASNYFSIIANTAGEIKTVSSTGATSRQNTITLADDATYTITAPGAASGSVIAGDLDEYIDFKASSTAVTSITASANTAVADTDANLCVYVSGGDLIIKNRLGASKTIKYVINH